MMAISMKTTIGKVIPSLTVFLFMFVMSIQQPLLRTMIFRKTCDTFYPTHVCSSLQKQPQARQKLRSFTEQYAFKVNIAEIVISAFMTILFGSLADKYGRKKILIIPCIGAAIFGSLMFVQVQLRSISTLLIMGSHIALGITGSKGTFMSTWMCYTTDKASPEKRAIDLSTLMAFAALGSGLGDISTGLFIKILDGPGVYLLVLFSQILFIALILVFVQEARISNNDAKMIPDKVGVLGQLKSLWEHFAAGPRLLFARQGGKRRVDLLLMMLASVLGMVCSTADSSFVGRQMQKSPFNWPQKRLSYFGNRQKVLASVGSFVITQAYLRFASSSPTRSELNLTFIAEVCNLMSVVAFVFPPMVTIVPIFALFTGPLHAATRSYLSGLVDPSETGALFGFIGFLTTFTVPLGAGIINGVYYLYSSFATPLTFTIVIILKSFILALIWIVRRRAIGGVKKGL